MKLKEQKFRHEIKHYISYFDYLELVSRLKYLTKRDENASPDGSYKVRSLYFDNLYDKALLEKVDGVQDREKFRIRYYNGDTSFIRLEKKSKRSGLCQKQSAVISKEQCLMLLDGNLQFLKESSNPLFLELYAKMHTQLLRPKSIVAYTRCAFVYPAGNVRLTIDKDILASSNVAQFLNPQLPCRKVSKTIIFEVKYDDFLPRVIADAIQINSRQAAAFSKYAVCRAL